MPQAGQASVYPLVDALDPNALNAAILASPIYAVGGEGTFAANQNYSGLQPYEAVVAEKQRLGLSLSATEQQVFSKISKYNFASSQYSGTTSNVGTFQFLQKYYVEHPVGSHYHGDLNAILDNISRAFTDIFTLGAAEIPIGGSTLGAKSGVQSLVSTELSGGAIQSKAPLPQIGLLEKVIGTGASLISGFGALTAAPEVAGETALTAARPIGVDSLATSESFGTFTKNLQTARLGLADFAGTTPQDISIASATPTGAALDVPTSQLGLTTDQLFAAKAGDTLGGAGKLGGKLSQYTGAGAAGNQVLNAIEHGNLSDIVNTVLGVAGIPLQIPGGSVPPPPIMVQVPASSPQPVAGGNFAGGGYSNPSYVADPAAVNIPMYIAGLGLLIVIGLVLFRRKG